MHRLVRTTFTAALRAAAPLLAIALGASSVAAAPADTPSRPGADAAASVAMIESSEAAADFWNRWRGPSGQGLVETGDGLSYPDRWTATENIVWKTPVPGRGNSSPIVWGDRIFLTTAENGGKERSLLAFDRTTGKRLWQVGAPKASPEKAHPKNGFASSTPTTDGERVYAYLGNHGVIAVNFDGELVWHRTLGTFEAFHGTASSPLLHRDRLIVSQDHGGDGGSFIVALNKRTGALIWRTEREARVGWNSPVAIRVAGPNGAEREEIVLSGQQQVTAYHPGTGKELWRARGNTFEAIPTPVVGHGLLFVSSGRAGPTLAIRPGGSGDVTDSHIVWKAPKGSPFVPSTILYGDQLYMVNDMAAIATSYHAVSGEVLWQGRLGTARREGFSASPVAFGGKIFFTSDEGETFVLKAGKEFEILHVNSLGENVLASPALVDGRWYVRTEDHLVAIGHSTKSVAAEGAP